MILSQKQYSIWAAVPAIARRLLVRAFPDAEVVGIDDSPNMLTVARARAPQARFVLEDIDDWQPEREVDLIFANAALHFARDHYQLIERLVGCLSPGGWLAAQMPNNMQEVSHALMRMISADGPWSDRLVPIAKTRAVIGPPEEYYRLLRPLCARFDIWQTTYIHPVDGPDQIVEWFEGAELRSFLKPLTAEELKAFLARYREGLAESYTPQEDGKVLLRYPRLFFVAQK